MLHTRIFFIAIIPHAICGLSVLLLITKSAAETRELTAHSKIGATLEPVVGGWTASLSEGLIMRRALFLLLLACAGMMAGCQAFQPGLTPAQLHAGDSKGYMASTYQSMTPETP
jgi:hypothetical protein